MGAAMPIRIPYAGLLAALVFLHLAGCDPAYWAVGKCIVHNAKGDCGK